MSLNKVLLIGNIASDIQSRATSTGTSTANFTLATDEVWKDKDGNKQKRTEFHRIVCFGKTAEQCSQFLKKGSKIYVEGSAQTRSYEDKTGQKKYTTEIKAESVQFLDKAPDVSAVNTNVPKPEDDFGW